MILRRTKWTGLLAGTCISIAALAFPGQAADKKDEGFRPGKASAFANRQESQGLTVAAEVYGTAEQARAPFGKVNPNDHGVLPILVLMESSGKKSLDLKRLRVQLITSTRQRLRDVPATEVKYLRPPERPKMIKPTPPFPGMGKKKNPLAASEIEGRAFAAPVLSPGDTAHGFFYFQAAPSGAVSLYITGIKATGSGQELFYIEVPLERP